MAFLLCLLAFPVSLAGLSTGTDVVLDPIIDLVEKGWRVILIYGNGHQVGNLLLKNEAGKHIMPVYPLDVCGTETAGSIDYIISQALENRMRERGIRKVITPILTQVLVDENDHGFQNPTKPVGSFYNEEDARFLEEGGYVMTEDSGRSYRRVVSSPLPIEILQKEAIKCLDDEGFLVVAVGGGGVPVVRDGVGICGVEAVIDKDVASALLAMEIQADCLMILTGVEKVAINFGKPTMKNLSEMTVHEAECYMAVASSRREAWDPKLPPSVTL